MPTSKDFISIDETAKKLDVSIPTVHRLLKKQGLGHIRIGRKYRVLRSDVEKMLQPIRINGGESK